MAAIIRIKRRLDEEPLDTVLINCKKQKTNNDSDENEVSTIFKRSISQTNTEDVLHHMKQSTKSKLEFRYKTHITDLHNKIKQEGQEAAKRSRYKVINLRRSAETTELETQVLEDGNITILDIEIDKDEAEVKNLEASEYVFDLYYTNSNNFPEIELNELISVYPLSDDLVYEDAQDNICENDCPDDSDSNDENNWRNDYPDESDHESITDEDMLNAINRMDLNGENELSSDDDEEGLVYSIDKEYDIDLTDVDRHGKSYAIFKAKFNRSNSSNHESCESSPESSFDNYY